MTPPAFSRELFLLYYDPTEDAFLIYIDEKKDEYQSPVYSPTWGRLNAVMPILTSALRNHFSDRFQGAAGGSSEFIIFVSTGDIPKLTCDCVRKEERVRRPIFCQNEIFAPILQFGSVYKDVTILPNLVAMPVWSHLPCFTEWQSEGSICLELKMRSDIAGVFGGEEALIADALAGELKQTSFSVWDTLTPTLVWRGSEWFFLNCIHPNLLPVKWDRDIEPRIAHFGNHARGVMQSLLELWDNLPPRWKAATLTAMAELDAEEMSEAGTKDNEGGDVDFEQQHHVPWIDAKFTIKSKIHGKHVEPMLDRYEPFQEYGIQMTSEQMMSLSELSKYKYHIDLGGGGGKIELCSILLHPSLAITFVFI